MSEQELNDLLGDLSGRGFNDEKLRQDILKNEAAGLPVFSIRREKVFGEDRMSYRLIFLWQESSVGFDLAALEATHRQPVDIDQQFVAGFDTTELDEDMAAVDWKAYWQPFLSDGQEPVDESTAAACIDGIGQLLLSESAEAVLTAEQLMYKHWPREIAALFLQDPDRVAKLYEHSYSFSLKQYPYITAELAYLTISERLDSLEAQMEEMRLVGITVEEVRNAIHDTLKDFPEQAVLTFPFSDKEYSATLNIPVKLIDTWYHLDTYRLELSALPAINHGVFDGVDSERLDKKLATVDWKNDDDIVFANEDGDLSYPRDIELLQEELFRVALHPGGRLVADQLLVRHYLNAPFFEDLITTSARQYLEGLPRKSAEFPVEIAVDAAINLLRGKLIMKENLAPGEAPGTWIRLEVTGQNGTANLVPVKGATEQELEIMVANLPVYDHEKREIITGLKTGRSVESQAKSGQRITIELAGNAREIRIFDRAHREIPFNVKLDPDWKPAIAQLQTKRNLSQETKAAVKQVPPVKPAVKQKGKGL